MGNSFNLCGKNGTETDEKKKEIKQEKIDNTNVTRVLFNEKPKIDPKELTFMDQKDCLLIKKQGSIKMNSFLIDGCENCQIFILDITAQITIDECRNCCIFMSPCESSVFIRNSENCKIVSISSQLRLRDCKNINIMLYAATNPCIETSINVNFFCYQFSYFNLIQQMDICKLNISNNSWNNVQDFGVDEKSIFEVKSNDTDFKDIFEFIFENMPNEIENELNPIKELVIPLTNNKFDTN